MSVIAQSINNLNENTTIIQYTPYYLQCSERTKISIIIYHAKSIIRQ